MKSVTSSVTKLNDNYGMIQLMNTKPGYKQTILLIDDEKPVLNSLQRLFRYAECDIITADSGEQAKELLQTIEPDVVISDVRMPGMDGVELLSWVAKKFPDTERFLLTGHADMAATVAAINSGRISHYFEKPWDDNYLLKMVNDALMRIDLKKHNTSLNNTIKDQNSQLLNMNKTLEKTVEQRTQEIKRANIKLEIKSLQLAESYNNFVELFVRLIEVRLGKRYTENTSTSALAVNLGKTLGLDEQALQALHYASRLRYIGLLELGDEVLAVPFHSMTDAQKSQFQQHPAIAHSMLSIQPPLSEAANIVLCYKECLNGSGFPHGLMASQIDLSARVLAVASDYTALCSGALFEETYTEDKALDYIVAHKDLIYSAEVVDALVYMVEADAHIRGESRLLSDELTANMVLSCDLLNNNGALLLVKGSVITEQTLEKIHEMEQRLDERLVFHVHT